MSRLESCQRRITKWCKPISHLSYPDRLKRLHLPTVESRFKRGDLILTFQILHHLIDIPPSEFFCMTETNTRGHNLRLAGQHSHLNIRHRFFTERVVSFWNSLEAVGVNSPSVNSFKAYLDKVL